MPVDDSRRPEPGQPQPGPAPIPSDDGLTGNEFGRPPSPGEAVPDSGEHQRAGEVAETAPPERPA